MSILIELYLFKNYHQKIHILDRKRTKNSIKNIDEIKIQKLFSNHSENPIKDWQDLKD